MSTEFKHRLNFHSFFLIHQNLNIDLISIIFLLARAKLIYSENLESLSSISKAAVSSNMLKKKKVKILLGMVSKPKVEIRSYYGGIQSIW